MKADFTYCTIKYKHCNKQKECKRWIANYNEDVQTKALYNSNTWFMDGLSCVEGGYELFIKGYDND